ncbi:hypothetical protein HDR63_00440 [bacterium]|nr:hypothetical protein [bacterium]
MPNPNVGLFSAGAHAATACSAADFRWREVPSSEVRDGYITQMAGNVEVSCTGKKDETGTYDIDVDANCSVPIIIFSVCSSGSDDELELMVDTGKNSLYSGTECFCAIRRIGSMECATQGKTAIWFNASGNFRTASACVTGCMGQCAERMNSSQSFQNLVSRRSCGKTIGAILDETSL